MQRGNVSPGSTPCAGSARLVERSRRIRCFCEMPRKAKADMNHRKTYNEIVRLQAELDELKGLEFEGAGAMTRKDTNPVDLQQRIVDLKQSLPGDDAYRRYGS